MVGFEWSQLIPPGILLGIGAIGWNYLRQATREIRGDIKALRGEMTSLNRCVGRIEGHLFKAVD